MKDAMFSDLDLTEMKAKGDTAGSIYDDFFGGK